MSHHDHSHNHSHDHADIFHSHAPAGKMQLAFFLTLFIFAAEIAGGWLSHSLALFSDAGHVLTDIAAIGLSWFAMKQSEKPANQEMTFGYYRAGILAAFLNGLLLILVTLWILWEAYQRFQHPQPVSPGWMFVSAGVGLCINLYLGLGMRHEEDINVKSAVLHMLGDAAASAGVIIGGLIILFTRWYLVDPLLSVLIAVLIALGAWRIVKQAVGILMEGTPKGIQFEKVVNEIKSVQGVQGVHDIHMWSITNGKNALSCHIILDGQMSIQESQIILRAIEHRLAHVGIGHATIQIEDSNHPHTDSEFCAAIETHNHS
ncbi:cation diffusion facilitator family transporter [Alicyclobacillus tolerans]|uniref:Cobalt-zinc-cadmium efflux system protein n=1 Tax=Alicyclobacillus tolerans TaxID=90970 RepID=A0A1M6TZQ0_9BACL|nr:cation diffusion facilitator family transporter [Alicyclobacillus montanus]SHK62391.1 cobalt-zinc-cadmium efflux system protein [Alicyclobacillus montanus]